MSQIYRREELLDLGFKSVGKNISVSKDARFFSITGQIGEGVRIDAYSILTGHILLGRDVHISPFCFLNGTGGVIRMGAGAGLSAHVSVFTKSEDYSKHRQAAPPKLTGNVTVGDRSIIGAGSTLMSGTRIGNNVSIGCNSVVNGQIQAGSIIVSRGTGLVTLSRRTAKAK